MLPNTDDAKTINTVLKVYIHLLYMSAARILYSPNTHKNNASMKNNKCRNGIVYIEPSYEIETNCVIHWKQI